MGIIRVCNLGFIGVLVVLCKLVVIGSIFCRLNGDAINFWDEIRVSWFVIFLIKLIFWIIFSFVFVDSLRVESDCKGFYPLC